MKINQAFITDKGDPNDHSAYRQLPNHPRKLQAHQLGL
jgi:hypothetical protein